MTITSGFGRPFILAGVLAGAATLLVSGSAYASAAAQPKPAAPHAHSVSSTHRKATTLSTRTSGVRIRSKAKLTKHSKIVATLPAAGSRVVVDCYKTGVNVAGDTTWYRTVSPKAGFVAGHELAISKEPAAGVTACKKKK